MTADPPTEHLAALRERRPDLYERGLALWETPVKVNELAWVAADALEAVRVLAEAGYCIFGGDVWTVTVEHDPRPAHNNWYFNPTGDLVGDVEVGRIAALRFIESYRPTGDDAVRFVLVWR